MDSIKDASKGTSNYKEILRDCPDPHKKEEFSMGSKSLDDIMYEDETRRYSIAFDW